MVYLAQGGFWTTLRFAIGVAGSIATVIAFGNLLPKEVYGTYSYLISLAGSLAFLSLSGVSTGVIRAVARGYESIASYAFALQLRYNSLASLTIVIGALYYGVLGNMVFAFSLLVLAISIPISASFFTFESVLIGQKKFKTLTKVTALSTLVGAVAMITAISLTDKVTLIIVVGALATLVPNFIIYRYVARSISGEKPSDESIREFRETSFHLTGAGLMGTIAQYLDKIVLFQVAGPAALATYGFAIAGPEKLKGLIKNWTVIALPKIAEKPISEVRDIYYRRFFYLILLGFSLSLVYIISSPILFKIILPRYLDSILYSQVYSLSLIIIPALIYVGTTFQGLNMLRAIYLHSFGTQVIRISLFLILGWKLGSWGIVIASISAYSLSTIYGVIIWEIESRRQLKIN